MCGMYIAAAAVIFIAFLVILIIGLTYSIKESHETQEEHLRQLFEEIPKAVERRTYRGKHKDDE